MKNFIIVMPSTLSEIKLNLGILENTIKTGWQINKTLELVSL